MTDQSHLNGLSVEWNFLCLLSLKTNEVLTHDMERRQTKPQRMTGFVMTALEITFEMFLICVATHVKLVLNFLLEPLITTGP